MIMAQIKPYHKLSMLEELCKALTTVAQIETFSFLTNPHLMKLIVTKSFKTLSILSNQLTAGQG